MSSSFTSPLVDDDLQTVWHPFTDAGISLKPIHITSGKGSTLFSENGKSYLDGISSWWSNLHGHAHPYIAEKISAQAQKLEHVIFADFTHECAVNYAKKLLKHMPEGISRIFYSDNGSTAVECALKMAIQYWQNLGEKKTKIIALKGGYHGDTFGSMSISGKNIFNTAFWPYLFEVIAIDPPKVGQEEESLLQMQSALQGNDVCCFIYEPLLQGACGMRTYSQTGLEMLLQFCRDQNVLLIADEVLTGFGRCGPLFISSTLKTPPDFIALSKGITGGFLPLGATLCREEIYQSFLGKPFLHGHTYSGNPICCAAAIASLELLEKDSCTQQREQIHTLHAQFVSKWRGIPQLKRLETMGTILILEYASTPPPKSFFHDHNILLRPLGDVYYVIPPYCINNTELNHIYNTLEKTWTS